MLISEQKYTNLNRLYYHGKIKDRKLLSNEFYLATKFAYAFVYSTGYTYGVVEEYRLKQTANIFNAKSITDEGNLRKFCQRNAPNILKYIELLKENDWKYIRDNQLREDLIFIIRELKYDGYFNLEIDQKMLDELHSRDVYKYDYHKHSPSVGIFNTGALVPLRSWDRSNFEDYEGFKDFKNEEIKKMKEDIKFEKSENKNNEEIARDLKKKILALTFEELEDIIHSITLKESLLYRENLRKYVDTFLKRFERV